MGTNPQKVAAVMLLAGVEPLLTASPIANRDIMSGWNLAALAKGNRPPPVFSRSSGSDDTLEGQSLTGTSDGFRT
jgi:hypothetical protein